MSNDIQIHGASDDLVRIIGGVADDEWQAYDGATITLKEPETDAGCVVTMKLDDNACWTATVGQLDEGVVIPWAIEIGHHPQTNYTVLVRLVDAAGAVVQVIT